MNLNIEKSSIVRLSKKENPVVPDICCRLGCKLQCTPISYLGLPLSANPRRRKTSDLVISKVEEKLSGWKKKLLCRSGKVVLIKCVLNSLHICYMSLFLMPSVVWKKLVYLKTSFLWGGDKDKRGLAMVSRKICELPKEVGGLD